MIPRTDKSILIRLGLSSTKSSGQPKTKQRQSTRTLIPVQNNPFPPNENSAPPFTNELRQKSEARRIREDSSAPREKSLKLYTLCLVREGRKLEQEEEPIYQEESRIVPLPTPLVFLVPSPCDDYLKWP